MVQSVEPWRDSVDEELFGATLYGMLSPMRDDGTCHDEDAMKVAVEVEFDEPLRSINDIFEVGWLWVSVLD